MTTIFFKNPVQPLKILESPRLQAEADKKSLGELIEIADVVVSPSNLTSNDEPDPVENVLLGMEWGIKLCEMARRKSTRLRKMKDGTFRTGNVGIYLVVIMEALGPCNLYFVGTIAEIMARLKELDDNWT